jgi:hypothetical protein
VGFGSRQLVKLAIKELVHVVSLPARYPVSEKVTLMTLVTQFSNYRFRRARVAADNGN